MTRQETAASRGRVGGQSTESNAAGRLSRVHDTTPPTPTQEHNAPDGVLPAYWRDGLIYVAGRHLCSVRAGVLRRTFDARRELFRGALLFRTDVLRVAIEHGASQIAATERSGGRCYRLSMDEFLHKGFHYSHRRYGAQVGCELRHWQTGDAGQGAVGEHEPTQLALFAKAATP